MKRATLSIEFKGKLDAVLSQLTASGVHVVRIRSPRCKNTEGFAIRRARTDARNQEIIAKYTADPKTHSCGKLAEEYKISRERVCQILRPVNAIGTAQGRRAAAKEALAEATAKLKAETAAAWEAKMAEAVELVRGGMSVCQAAAAVGFETSTLNKRCRLAKIPVHTGRHRDFSERIKRVKELSARRFTIPEIVRMLRATTDPHIHEPWVYTHVPEARIRPRRPRQTPP